MPKKLNQPIVRPWYREPWVWFLLGIVGLGVVSGTSVLIIGIANAPQMVSGNYQPLGKVLVDGREQARRAHQLGLSAELELDGERATVLIDADHIADLPDQLLLRFEHPANADRDLTSVARRVDTARWEAQFGEIAPPARARVILSDLEQTWWLGGRFSAESAGHISLTPDEL